MKKLYSTPVCDMIILNDEDVITTSPVDGGKDGTEIGLPEIGLPKTNI